MTGIVIVSFHSKWGQAFAQEMPALVANGEMKYKEDMVWGLEHTTQALLDVLTGKNVGKKVIVIAEE